MTLPLFPVESDPGPSFIELLNALGHSPAVIAEGSAIQAPHGTTICAMRYSDGVLMAGDRRATAGNIIAHRGVEKVFPADNYSGVAISGTVGPALEMVKTFQTSLEHYEKVEESPLSLEGKANQLEQLIRQNLGLAMQGLVVIPLFAGYDTKRETGRVFSYDITGGRTEETDYSATGSGGRDASAIIKMRWHEAMTRDEVIALAVRALFGAADEDTATGGPDMMRGIYPLLATITADGYEEVADDVVAGSAQALIAELQESRS